MKNAHWPEPVCLTISGQLGDVEKALQGALQTSHVGLIKDASSHIVTNGGKRLRPALAILSSKICGYSGENVVHLGAAIELIHTASIIHDDVLDSAELRRGVPAANAKWGNHLSILVGDYCLSLASQMLSNHTTMRVISILTDAATKTTEGEVLEVINDSNISIDVDTYLNIIRLKTAYLIAASCEAGSSLAEAPPKLTSALRDYGMNLGMAFQITDDILDYTIESVNLGKKRGTDLKEGKLTLPLIYALTLCNNEEKEIIKESLLAPTYSEDHFKSVINILERHNCVQRAKETARKYMNEAIHNLSSFRPSLEREAMIRFAGFVVERRC